MGGTLLVTRSDKNQTFYKQKLEKEFGFSNVTVTSLDYDGLNSLIRELRPDLLLMGARFYERSTPYMMGKLKRRFSKIKMAALSLEGYPDEIAMWFYFNGIKSYDTAFDGFEQFFEGLKVIGRGREYRSPCVQERIDLRDIEPDPVDDYTARQAEVMHLICGGWKDEEIARNLHISRRTVDTHKTNIFTIFNVRNERELIIVAQKMDVVKLDEIVFYPKDLVLNPKPQKEKTHKADTKKTSTGGKIYDFKNESRKFSG